MAINQSNINYAPPGAAVKIPPTPSPRLLHYWFVKKLHHLQSFLRKTISGMCLVPTDYVKCLQQLCGASKAQLEKTHLIIQAINCQSESLAHSCSYHGSLGQALVYPPLLSTSTCLYYPTHFLPFTLFLRLIFFSSPFLPILLPLSGLSHLIPSHPTPWTLSCIASVCLDNSAAVQRLGQLPSATGQNW